MSYPMSRELFKDITGVHSLDDSASLLANIGPFLRQRNWKVAVAESLTGGRLQALLTSQSGSSDYFAGGVTAYGIAEKVELLNVDHEEAAATNCVSADVCLQMAAGAAQLFKVEATVATTGYAEPCPDAEVEQPMAFVAVQIGDASFVEQIVLEGDRNSVQDAVAVTALLLFWEAIQDQAT